MINIANSKISTEVSVDKLKRDDLSDVNLSVSSLRESALREMRPNSSISSEKTRNRAEHSLVSLDIRRPGEHLQELEVRAPTNQPLIPNNIPFRRPGNADPVLSTKASEMQRFLQSVESSEEGLDIKKTEKPDSVLNLKNRESERFLESTKEVPDIRKHHPVLDSKQEESQRFLESTKEVPDIRTHHPVLDTKRGEFERFLKSVEEIPNK